MTVQDSIGPIDVALLEFPDQTPTGAVAAELLAAADSGAIAIYDILAVRKRPDGSVEGFELSELDDGGVAMSVFASARSGLLGADDVADAGSVMAPGSMAVVPAGRPTGQSTAPVPRVLFYSTTKRTMARSMVLALTGGS